MDFIGHTPDYTDLFGDKRLERRGKRIASTLLTGKKSSIHGVTSDQSEQKGFYRFLANEKVTEAALIKELTTRCSKNVLLFSIQGKNIFVDKLALALFFLDFLHKLF